MTNERNGDDDAAKCTAHRAALAAGVAEFDGGLGKGS
jgi:hypothetical protein